MEMTTKILIEDYLEKLELASYRVKQFNIAFYQNFVRNFDELTTFSKDLRAKLSQTLPFSTLTSVDIKKGEASKKVILETLDENSIESVLIQESGRNTVCLSTQIGCPVGCEFCATGKMGFIRNLSVREIIDQVLFWARNLHDDSQKITNIVYMGMGEPLLNLEAVLNSVKILTDPEKLGFGQRRITISTVGILEPLKKLLSQKRQFKVAISLHAPEQELRDQLIPISKANPLSKLMEILKNYTHKFNKRISYEYLLLKGINDSKRHATELAKLLADQQKLAFINLIMFNPGPNSNFKRVSDNVANAFKQILENSGFNSTIRYSEGGEINGACGQLITDLDN